MQGSLRGRSSGLGGEPGASYRALRLGATPHAADGAPDEGSEAKGGEASRRALVCRRCGQLITSRDQAMEVEGRHEHTFANPHGYVYRIGCFLEAPGAVALSRESTEFSWFEGHSWRVLGCGGCGALMGWVFQDEETRRFRGLILDHLAETAAEDERGAP